MAITKLQIEAIRPLLKAIYARESGSNYDAVNRGVADDTKAWKGTGGRRLTQHTLGEVRALQAADRLFAVGAVQVVPETLTQMVREMGLKPDAVFDAELQDRIAAQLVLGAKRPRLRDYLLGKLSGGPALAKAVDELAFEWASFPNSKGFGWYDDDKGGNKAKGKVAEVEQVLLAVRSNLARPAAEAAAAATAGEVVLYQLVATRDTWLKKKPVQAGELSDAEKVLVLQGQGYGVLKHQEVAAHGHAEVTLSHGAGTWFVFEADWSRPGTASPARSEVLRPEQINWADFSCQITPFLTVGEVLQWDHRRRPPANSANIRRILLMAEQHLAIRKAWGAPLGVTSFYRPEPINRQVGGVPNSWHVTGQAIDIYPVGRPLESLYQHLMQRWSGGLGDGRHRGFIHLDQEGGGHYVPGGGVRPRRWWTY